MPGRVFVVPFLVVWLALSACSEGATPTAPLSFTGSDGVTVTFEAPPRRIVSLAAHATEIFCALGAADQLVAVERFANCPPGSRSKPEVDAFHPSVEAIIALEPDLVYAWYDPGDVVGALRRAGVPVLFLEVPDSIAGVFENVELIGRLTGREHSASVLVTQMTARRDHVLGSIREVTQGPRFFHELDRELFTVRSDTFIGELYQLLKARNIADRADTPYPQFSSEAVVAANPEVIVLAYREAPEAVKRRPGWSAISAVANDRICEVDGDLVSRPGPRIMDGLAALHECLYGRR